MLTSLAFCLAIGLPLFGILLGAQRRAQRWMRPFPDAQTTPAFVYLRARRDAVWHRQRAGVVVTIVFARCLRWARLTNPAFASACTD